MFASSFSHPARWLLGCLAVFMISGCSTVKNPYGLGTRVAVLINHQEPEAILAEAREAFQESGYEMITETKSEMVLEQKGSGWQSAAYGDWGGGVWKRVRLVIEDHGLNTLALEAKASLVRGRGDAFFEEEEKPSRGWKQELQATLESVRARLE